MIVNFLEVGAAIASEVKFANDVVVAAVVVAADGGGPADCLSRQTLGC